MQGGHPLAWASDVPSGRCPRTWGFMPPLGLECRPEDLVLRGVGWAPCKLLGAGVSPDLGGEAERPVGGLKRQTWTPRPSWDTFSPGV